MLNNKLIWTGAAVILITGVILLLRHGAPSAQATTAQATFRVQRGPLVISVTQAGTIKAREMTIIKNEVEGRTSIISLIPEGTRVQQGDLLVELDASGLIDSRLDQEIRVQNAEAAYVGAKENVEVVKNQAQSDIDKATLSLQFAREDLQKYIDGEYPNELKRAEANITLAQEELTRALERLDWSRRLFEEKFISKTELQADELNEKKRHLDLELARNNRDLLTQFTYKRNLTQLESNVSQAEMAMDRVVRKARAEIVQAEATLVARELEYNRQKSRLEKIQEQIVKARIVAPSSGQVIYATSAVTGGRRFSIEPLIEGREVREREELIYLPTTASSKADVSIHESNLEKIRVGLPAIITVDALPGRKYLGRLANIAPLPDAQSMWMNPDLKVYNTEIFLEDNDDALRTGMSCQAEIVAAKYDDALYVPVQAVIRVGGRPTVYVVKGKSLEERPVEIGMDNNRMVHILSGLTADEDVLLTPPLKAGAVEAGAASGGSPQRQAIQERVLERLNTAQPPADTAPASAEAAEGLPPRLDTLTPEQREQMRRRFEEMTPEQREQMRQQMRQGGEARPNRPARQRETSP